jgi:hypothetical protein
MSVRTLLYSYDLLLAFAISDKRQALLEALSADLGIRASRL